MCGLRVKQVIALALTTPSLGHLVVRFNRWPDSSVAKAFPSTRPVAQAHTRGGLVVAFEYGFCRGYQELELAVPAIKGAVWFNRTSR
jgi:hypothetical protein